MSGKSPNEEVVVAIRARREQLAAAGASPTVAPHMVSAPASEPTSGGRRGFAAMDETRQRQIASLGGRTAHERGQAHEFTPDEAREAGRKGGESVSRNREHMAAIGRRGGAARSLSMQRRQPAPPSSPRTASA